MKEIPIYASEQTTISELFQHQLFLFYANGEVVENWRDSEQLYHDVIPIWETEAEDDAPPTIVFLSPSNIFTYFNVIQKWSNC